MRRGHSRLWLLAAVAITAAVVLVACDTVQLEVPDLAISVAQGDSAVREGDLLLSEIVGAGKRYSGAYYVAGVSHSIDASGHRMSIELLSNAWDV